MLLGSRIFTDSGVCRHQAAFLTDVNNAYGYDSVTLHVRGMKENNPLLYVPMTKAIQTIVANHAATGVCTEKGKILVDPTWSTLGEFYDDRNVTIYPFNKVIQNNYFVANPWIPYSLFMNNFDINKITRFEKSDYRKIDDDEYRQCHNEFSDILRDDKLKFIEFRKKNLKLIKTISELHKDYIDLCNNYNLEHLELKREDDPSWNYCDHTDYLTSKDYELMFKNKL